MTLRIAVLEDTDQPPGYAIIRVTGVSRVPRDASFIIRPFGDEAAPRDWPTGLQPPLRATLAGDVWSLHVGPRIVDIIPQGVPVTIEFPDLGEEASCLWPVLEPSQGDWTGAGETPAQGSVVPTEVIGGAPVTIVTPPVIVKPEPPRVEPKPEPRVEPPKKLDEAPKKPEELPKKPEEVPPKKPVVETKPVDPVKPVPTPPRGGVPMPVIAIIAFAALAVGIAIGHFALPVTITPPPPTIDQDPVLAAALSDLGTTYWRGVPFERVKSNPALAVQIWTLAAERGSGWAMFNLAVYYSTPGAAQDREAALDWARNAATSADETNDSTLRREAGALVDKLQK